VAENMRTNGERRETQIPRQVIGPRQNRRPR
jgi:hypothetical protein